MTEVLRKCAIQIYFVIVTGAQLADTRAELPAQDRTVWNQIIKGHQIPTAAEPRVCYDDDDHDHADSKPHEQQLKSQDSGLQEHAQSTSWPNVIEGD